MYVNDIFSEISGIYYLFLALQVVDGKLKMRKSHMRGKMVTNEIAIKGGPLSVVLLDMTWSDDDYWDQAKTKLMNLLANAPGLVYVATLSPFSKTPALFKNQIQFQSRVLPLLSQRAKNKGTFYIFIWQ